MSNWRWTCRPAGRPCVLPIRGPADTSPLPRRNCVLARSVISEKIAFRLVHLASVGASAARVLWWFQPSVYSPRLGVPCTSCILYVHSPHNTAPVYSAPRRRFVARTGCACLHSCAAISGKKRKQHRHSKKRIICAVSSLVYICLLLLLLLLLHCALASGAMHWNRSCLFVLCLCLCVFVALLPR